MTTAALCYEGTVEDLGFDPQAETRLFSMMAADPFWDRLEDLPERYGFLEEVPAEEEEVPEEPKVLEGEIVALRSERKAEEPPAEETQLINCLQLITPAAQPK